MSGRHTEIGLSLACACFCVAASQACGGGASSASGAGGAPSNGSASGGALVTGGTQASGGANTMPFGSGSGGTAPAGGTNSVAGSPPGRGAAGSGVIFRAGEGVGTVTRPGLPLPPGEPAINPVPRQMMRAAIAEAAAAYGDNGDVEIEIAIPGGEALAAKTLNGRLGIVGGLSILGTTGIVVPYSCSAWIHSIHRGIDVARAAGLTHIAGATGAASEAAAKKLHGLQEIALIDMGDFVGGILKYVRSHPVARVTIAGGVGKMTKLAQGLLDLHSRRGSVDLAILAELAKGAGGSEALDARILTANTAAEAFAHAEQDGIALGDAVARAAHATAAKVVAGKPIEIEIAVFDRDGRLVGRAPFAPAHAAPPLKRRR